MQSEGKSSTPVQLLIPTAAACSGYAGHGGLWQSGIGESSVNTLLLTPKANTHWYLCALSQCM